MDEPIWILPLIVFSIGLIIVVFPTILLWLIENDKYSKDVLFKTCIVNGLIILAITLIIFGFQGIVEEVFKNKKK